VNANVASHCSACGGREAAARAVGDLLYRPVISAFPKPQYLDSPIWFTSDYH
jgi:hypothetical protein